MAVDKEVFRVAGHIIEDQLNIMWADQETRSPHHPLRDLNMLFGYNEELRVWGFRDNVLDAVYDNGSYPSRGHEPRAKVITKAPTAASGNILVPIGTGKGSKAASFELVGDFIAGQTIQASGTLTGATLPTWDTGAWTVPYNMTANTAAVKFGNFMRGIDELSTTQKGNKVSVFPIGPAATQVEILTLVIT